MITITINFSSSKILCGLSMMYWVETVTDFQYRDQISGIFSPSYVQVRPGKPLLWSFLPKNCSKPAVVGSWWVSSRSSAAAKLHCMLFLNLSYELDHNFCWLFLQFWVSISLCSPSRQSFYCFFMVFT